jgi:hypothetical protein
MAWVQQKHEQPNKSVDLVVVGGAKHSSSDNNSLLADWKYCQKVDAGQKLPQFAFWDNFQFFGRMGLLSTNSVATF